ncbi:hypothetical protein H8959_001726 [Pygathrix nigripes]
MLPRERGVFGEGVCPSHTLGARAPVAHQEPLPDVCPGSAARQALWAALRTSQELSHQARYLPPPHPASRCSRVPQPRTPESVAWRPHRVEFVFGQKSGLRASQETRTGGLQSSPERAAAPHRPPGTWRPFLGPEKRRGNLGTSDGERRQLQTSCLVCRFHRLPKLNSVKDMELGLTPETSLCADGWHQGHGVTV